MLSIPATLLLGIFGALFIILLVMLSANIYHGFRFGRNDGLTMTVNFVVIALVVGIILTTALFLAPVDWSATYTLSLPINSASSTLPSVTLPSETKAITSIFSQ